VYPFADDEKKDGNSKVPATESTKDSDNFFTNSDIAMVHGFLYPEDKSSKDVIIEVTKSSNMLKGEVSTSSDMVMNEVAELKAEMKAENAQLKAEIAELKAQISNGLQDILAVIGHQQSASVTKK
jgi:gas vesicle protein